LANKFILTSILGIFLVSAYYEGEVPEKQRLRYIKIQGTSYGEHSFNQTIRRLSKWHLTAPAKPSTWTNATAPTAVQKKAHAANVYTRT
jgi:hypothetical protein